MHCQKLRVNADGRERGEVNFPNFPNFPNFRGIREYGRLRKITAAGPHRQRLPSTATPLSRRSRERGMWRWVPGAGLKLAKLAKMANF
jgi:hypothetical protein